MLDIRQGIAALTAISAGALAFAYTAQYGFNLQPCVLCLYQRAPYFAVLALGAIVWLRPAWSRYMLWGMLAAFVAGLGLSGYHVGVEQGWWQGTKACGGGALPVGASAEDLRQWLLNQPIVRCDVPAWKLLGISMTGYNFLLSAFLAAVAAFMISRKK